MNALMFLMDTGAVVGLVIGLSVLVILLIVFFACGYVKAAPDTAIIISGAGKKKILIGKAGYRLPFFQRLDRLSLRVFW